MVITDPVELEAGMTVREIYDDNSYTDFTIIEIWGTVANVVFLDSEKVWNLWELVGPSEVGWEVLELPSALPGDGLW